MNTKIYIASSWKNKHAVEMLTALLREQGAEVLSFIENGYQNTNPGTTGMTSEEWIDSEAGDRCFRFDVESAMGCHLFIYLGPSGKDAAAECGMAFASKIPMVGLHAKGEDFGLMSRMFDAWFDRYTELLEFTKEAIFKRKAIPYLNGK